MTGPAERHMERQTRKNHAARPKRPDDPDAVDERKLRAAQRQVAAIQEKALARITQAEGTFRRSQDQLDAAVRAARNAGCTWQAIGEVFGTTRSAAEQRFHHVGADRRLR